MTDEQIRACGFSFAKIKAIRDIAEKTLSGVVPTSRQIVKLSDDEIIARLTEVRGVGRWTVEMLLIFQLGRQDVLPADDFGVRTGFRVAYKKRDLPKPKELLAHGERWKPHRTTAAWYLWRAADAAKKKKRGGGGGWKKNIKKKLKKKKKKKKKIIREKKRKADFEKILRDAVVFKRERGHHKRSRSPARPGR